MFSSVLLVIMFETAHSDRCVKQKIKKMINDDAVDKFTWNNKMKISSFHCNQTQGHWSKLKHHIK